MASKQKRSKTPQPLGVERQPVVHDPDKLGPVWADYAHIMVTPDMVIHSVFQTRPPLELPLQEPVETVLIARFGYPFSFFKSLVALCIRQYLVVEATHNRKREAITWLRNILDAQERDAKSTAQS
jgi:hypothetical protein